MLPAVQIFLAEDDEDDALFFELAFKKSFPDCQISVFPDGTLLLEALNNLEAPPTCIFLDINMPVLNGLDTLASLKGSSQTARIPTFMFTSSDYKGDIEKSRQLGADSFFTKPVSYSDLVNLAESFKSNWHRMYGLTSGEEPTAH